MIDLTEELGTIIVSGAIFKVSELLGSTSYIWTTWLNLQFFYLWSAIDDICIAIFFPHLFITKKKSIRISRFSFSSDFMCLIYAPRIIETRMAFHVACSPEMKVIDKTNKRSVYYFRVERRYGKLGFRYRQLTLIIHTRLEEVRPSYVFIFTILHKEVISRTFFYQICNWRMQENVR